MYVCVPWWPEESNRFPTPELELTVIDCLVGGCWELNSGLLESSKCFQPLSHLPSSYSILHITLPYILSSVSYTILAFLVDLNTLSRLLSLGLTIG